MHLILEGKFGDDPYRNKSLMTCPSHIETIPLICSAKQFLYDRNIRHERVNSLLFHFRSLEFKPIFFPLHPSSTPWKHQKTVRFSDVFSGQRKDVLGTNGLNKNWRLKQRQLFRPNSKDIMQGKYIFQQSGFSEKFMKIFKKPLFHPRYGFISSKFEFITSTTVIIVIINNERFTCIQAAILFLSLGRLLPPYLMFQYKCQQLLEVHQVPASYFMMITRHSLMIAQICQVNWQQNFSQIQDKVSK